MNKRLKDEKHRQKIEKFCEKVEDFLKLKEIVEKTEKELFEKFIKKIDLLPKLLNS